MGLKRMADSAVSPVAFLAEAVSARRAQLGLSQQGVHDAGGPSLSSLSRVELARSRNFPRVGVLDRLDTGLQWAPGSARRCQLLQAPVAAEGSVPVDRGRDDYIAGVRQKRAVSSREKFETAQQPLPGNPLDFEFVEVSVHVLRRGLVVIEENLTPADLQGGKAALDALINFAQSLSSAHATEVLERCGGPEYSVPPFLLRLFEPYLSERLPFDSPTADQEEDQRYRRWLVGTIDDPSGKWSLRLRRKLRSILAADDESVDLTP